MVIVFLRARRDLNIDIEEARSGSPLVVLDEIPLTWICTR